VLPLSPSLCASASASAIGSATGPVYKINSCQFTEKKRRKKRKKKEKRKKRKIEMTGEKKRKKKGKNIAA